MSTLKSILDISLESRQVYLLGYMDTPAHTPPKLLWTVEELAAAAHLSRSFVYQQIAAGRIQTVHIGRACRITPEAVERFIRCLQVGEE
jgi:excisionase family DNA binding protein